MNAQIRKMEDSTVGVVAIEGEIDFSVLAEVRQALDEAMSMDINTLLVDLSRVSFIASDGLGLFIEAHRQADDAGHRFELVHPQPHILGMLRKTQLTKLFNVYETVDDAIRGGAPSA